MTVGGPSDLVTNAALFRLDVYPDSVACNGNEVPAGSVPIQSRTFTQGQEIKLDIPPGNQTLVLTTFADEAGTMIMGTGCTTADLKPGGKVCLNLTIAAAPDMAVNSDLSTNDIASCSGADCPCTTSPDDCPAGQFCGSGLLCQSGCKMGSDCNGMGPGVDGGLPLTSCNTTLHQCVECTSNDQCPLGKVCSPAGACVVGCDGSHACPGGLTCCNSLCLDTTSDPLNCGMCGNPCTGAAHTCCASSCVDLTASADNCGSCGHACSASGVATRHCTTSACAPACSPHRADCTHPAVDDGCETDTALVATCGGCGNRCDTTPGRHANPPTCNADGGICVYGCTPPFADCDSTTAPDTNGCETDTSSDKLNCGTCQNACDTTTDNGTTCTGSTCGHASCKTNQADCNSPNHNQNECETLATDATQACGTDSCTPCITGGIVTTRSCTIPGNGSAFCSYTCDNTNCPNTNASSHTCDGTFCVYICSGGFIDCNSATAPDNDGCECPTASTAAQGTVNTCCPSTSNKCQVQHDTGFTSEHFYDCTTLGTLTGAEATAACIAHTGDVTGNSCHAGFCGASMATAKDGVICDAAIGTGTGACDCWDFNEPGKTGLEAGLVSVAASGGCLCPNGSNDLTWQ